MTTLKDIERWLKGCTRAQRREVFRQLRIEFPIHPLEQRLNADAEVILEAIERAGGLTLRMIRGVIAEAAFDVHVAERLRGWKNTTPPGDLAYDFRLEDAAGPVRVQVKLQRCKEHRPMWAKEASRWFPADMYVVETQRTRRGTRAGTGAATRPYRFGEFDILAVCLQPSTSEWHSFRYTVTDWLVPVRSDPAQMSKFQPVPSAPNDDWTDDFRTVVRWFRIGETKTIAGDSRPK
ncbi:MAG: hypothetical protein KY476_21005 [Planctomycetes bacterium]|nr:hypothetical protein [Planctomycetota bacterium]